MQRMKITAGHQQAMPYLVVENADDFIDFIRKIFNAQEMIRKVDAAYKVEHSEVMIGDATIMITEASKTYPAQHTSMYVYVKDTDQTYYNAIDAGSTSLMQPMEEDYGARGAGFKDPYGNTWWIATLN
ncbi:VOC family protein [Aquimarina sp. BL5]|uniref:VOC family protein n=2 Tax=Aquimarina sp. BL5 TaxID=1714860 RepID=UPI000E484510|nr:VOC family protein [Aquimarina sp. BL5]AXT52054.1 VOC family protein [Aquimarina sp. BL5]RKN11166.1 VOC family protein [Aquimarina sp. BL5]